jgi:hypothetical protein
MMSNQNGGRLLRDIAYGIIGANDDEREWQNDSIPQRFEFFVLAHLGSRAASPAPTTASRLRRVQGPPVVTLPVWSVVFATTFALR